MFNLAGSVLEYPVGDDVTRIHKCKIKVFKYLKMKKDVAFERYLGEHWENQNLEPHCA